MSVRRKVGIWIAVIAGLGILVAALSTRRQRPRQLTSLTGAVLRKDADPRKQQPIANAEITVADAVVMGETKSDPSGFFRLTMRPGINPYQTVTLRVRHPDYQPLNLAIPAEDRIHIIRMMPAPRSTEVKPRQPEVTIADVRVRYAVKMPTTMNVGSVAQPFEVPNTANVPCNGQPPCSPDGKWKATIVSKSLDAQEGNEFRNARVSCIAGPCAFTKVESDDFFRNGRVIHVSVRNWGETATYLIEAEVTRTRVSEMIRQSHPAIFGQAMNFTLPPTTQGPSIEAEVNGEDIVFPLGPNLILSWANCSAKTAPDHTKLYRCELKPGYRFKQPSS